MNLGLDVDGPLSKFGQAFIDKAISMGLGDRFPANANCITKWMFCSDEDYKTVWSEIENDHDFWLNIPPVDKELETIRRGKIKPVVYVTHRPVPSSITVEWFAKHGIKDAKVISVGDPLNKLLQLKLRKVDTFVDDRVDTTKHLRDNGINAFLYKLSHQQEHPNHGLPTIESLEELLTL